MIITVVTNKLEAPICSTDVAAVAFASSAVHEVAKKSWKDELADEDSARCRRPKRVGAPRRCARRGAHVPLSLLTPALRILVGC